MQACSPYQPTAITITTLFVNTKHLSQTSLGLRLVGNTGVGNRACLLVHRHCRHVSPAVPHHCNHPNYESQLVYTHSGIHQPSTGPQGCHRHTPQRLQPQARYRSIKLHNQLKKQKQSLRSIPVNEVVMRVWFMPGLVAWLLSAVSHGWRPSLGTGGGRPDGSGHAQWQSYS